jgi:hypothetical protein
LRRQRPNCIIVDPATPGLDAAMLIEKSETPECSVPLIVYSEQPLAEHDLTWQRFAKSPVVHQVHSLERLMDRTLLCLHQNVRQLSKPQQRALEEMYESNKILAEKRVLIVDDDIRNIFALTSVLEQYEMNVLSADNGRDAILLLNDEKNEVDAVLMDIMMPEMDGLDTTREIRKIPGRRDLPVIAVTAKAMKGDRDRCLEAGAWDYLSKPVNKEQLLSVLRLWLQR